MKQQQQKLAFIIWHLYHISERIITGINKMAKRKAREKPTRRTPEPVL